MQALTRFSANGNSFDIPDADTPSFLKDAPDAQRVRRFTAGENTFDIPVQEADAFVKDAPDAVEMRTLRYRANDGTDKMVDVPIKGMSEFLRGYKTDEEYAADRALGRSKAESAAQKIENDGIIWSAVKGFGEALLRSVTDSENLWRETYGDGIATDALKGANASANKIVNAVLGLGADLESTASLAVGGKNTTAGNWLADRATGDRAALERTFPSQVGESLGYEDWATKTADWFGNTSATIIKFAAGDKDPTKLFNAGVVATAASDSYAQSYDNAIAHGKSVGEANYIASGSATWNALMTMFLMKAFKGEAQAVQSQVGKTAREVIKREAKTAAQTGVTMGAQAAGNEAIGANAEGRRLDPENVMSEFAKGFGEGAAFHAYSAFGAQVSEYGRNAAESKEWVANFQDHILNSNTDRETYLRTPFGDAVRGICESVQDGRLPDRKAFVSAGIPKELCKTEAQRRGIAEKFMETMQLSADAQKAESARRVIDLTEDVWMNAYQRRQEELASNTVPVDRRLWNGRKVVAERTDLGDGRFGYNIYDESGSERKLITTSDEPLLRDAYADARNDMMDYFGMERKATSKDEVKEPLLREQIEAEAKTEAEKQKTEEAKDENSEKAAEPEVALERAPEVPGAGEAGGRDEGMETRGELDATSRSEDTAPVAEASAPSEEQVAPTESRDKQPTALARANAEAKTADARRAAQMETPALEDEIATLEGLGKLSKKRQRQLVAYKAELEKRKANEERPNLDDTPDEFDDTNDPLNKPIEERTKPDTASPASSPSAETPKPALTPASAAKLLGADAYNKAALQAKLKQWNAHPTDANAPHRVAAKLMLEKLEGPMTSEPIADAAPVAEPTASSALPRAEESVAPVATPNRRPGKKATKAQPNEPTEGKFDYEAAQKTVVDYFKATPEERATMPIADTLKAIKANDDITLRHGIQKAINEMIADIDIGRRFDQAEYDQFIRYAKTIVGEKVPLTAHDNVPAVNHNLRPRTKAGPEARRVNREKAGILKDIDDTLSMSLGDKSGIIKQYDADIAKAKADGNKKIAESLASLKMAELDGIRLGKNGVVIKVPNSNATYTVRTAGQLARLREKIEKEYGKNSGRVYYDRTTTERDAAKLEDPAFREWSQKRGTNADDAEALQRDRIAYDLDRAEQAAKRTGNWLGLKVVRETDPNAKPEGAKALKGEGGKTVGWYDPRTKEVHLLPGADEKTVSHELGWHATYDWALKNNPTLARTMEQYAENAPEALKAEIRKLYGRDLTPAELIEEIGAGRFEREHGGKLQKLLADRANRAWYTKVWDGIKDAYKAVLTKLGFNRVNLDEALKDKTPEQAMEFLASAMAKGKALGKLRTGKGTDRAPMEARVPAPSSSGTGHAVDVNAKFRLGERYLKQMKDSDIALRVADEYIGRYRNGDHTEDSLHLAKRLVPGLRQVAMDRRDRYEGDLAKIMRQHDITIGDIDDYLLSVAVPERNARLAAQGITDGAGMTDAEAAQLAADLRTKLGDAGFNQVKRAANVLWAMQREGMAKRIASGRVTQAVYDAWHAAESHHVPMRTDFTDANEYGNTPTGGYKRSEFKAAHGRTERADSPTAFIFDEYTDAALSSIDNDLRVKLADAVRLNPELGRVVSANRVENGFVILGDQAGRGLKVEPKREQYGKKPQRGEDPNLILFKENGELKAIELEGDLGKEIADSITDRMVYDFAGVGHEIFGRTAGDWFKAASSAYASTATKWSPSFMLRNFVKDQIELNLQNIGEYGLAGGAKSAAKQFKGAFDAVAPISHYIKTKKFDTSTEMGRYFKRYVEAGGQIGGASNEGYAEIVRRFDKYHLATKKGKAKMLVDALVRANEISEMMNRVANFKNACESGMSDRQAALKARDDSVDFNNFGRQKWLNAVYNFSNSVTGGTLRQAFYLTRKYGKGLAAGLFAYGLMEGLAEVLMNPDDDARAEEGLPSEETMSEYQRANSAYVRVGGKFYRLPIHAGIFSTIKYAGNGAARMMFGKLTWEQYADSILGEARDTAKHFSGTGDVAGGDSTIGTLNVGDRGEKLNLLPNLTQSFSPSVLQGFTQLNDYGPNSPKEAGTGLTFAGTPLRNRSFNDNEPQAYNGRKSTPLVYHKVAQALNAMSGGNEHRKGNWDMAPEDLKVIAEALGKNALKDAANAISLLMTPFDEDARAEWRINKTPFVGDFVRDVPENDTLYYKEMDRFAADKNEYDHLEGKEKQSFAEDHRLVKRPTVVAGQPGKRKIVEEKSEAERLTDEIKEMRNLEKSDKIEMSTVSGTPGHRRIVRKPVDHAYTPEERVAAERARRKKQARFIRLSHEEDERRAR